MSGITRFSISMDSKLLERFDYLIIKHGYSNRSEAFRDLVRERLVREEWEEAGTETVGTITIVYDHHKHDLTENLIEHQHQHHKSIISTMHIHLDNHNCLEVMAVKGMAKEIRKIADELISTKGVKHGKLVMTSTGRNL